MANDNNHITQLTHLINQGDLKTALTFVSRLPSKHRCAVPLLCGFEITSDRNMADYLTRLLPQLKKACSNKQLPK